MRRDGLSALLVGLLACGGEPITIGLEEPVRVEGSQFRAGILPGALPLTAAELGAGAQPTPPFSTPPEVAGRIVSPREVGFVVSGRATTDTYAVGFQLVGLGSGHWIMPVGAPDPINNGELTWRASLDFGASLPPGLHGLRVAALDGEGRAGTQRELELCVRAPTSDNLNACDPSIEPPALVVSLAWESSADLDLGIVSPDGAHIERGSTRGIAGGQLERDANSGCIASGAARENVVFQDSPPPGVYQVFVNLHDPCGDPSATFELATYEREELEAGNYRQVETFRTAGVAVSLQANGGRERGLLVTEVHVD